jgi:putative ABC transport system permease protein
MNFKELLRQANRNLLRNKIRTLLTILAIFVGAFTLTITNAVGDGMKDYIERQVKNFEGSGVLFIRKKMDFSKEAASDSPPEYKEDSDGPSPGPSMDQNLSLAQIEALSKEFPEVEAITPSYYQQAEYITLDGSKKYMVMLNALARGMSQKIEKGSQISGKNQIILQL